MTFHSKSVVEFGHLLNDLTKNLTDGAPIPAALDVVRDHFDAKIVLLGISSRGGDSVFLADSQYGAFGEGKASYDKNAMLGALIERYQHIAATECGTGSTRDYSMWVFRDRDDERFDNEETALAGVLVAQIARAIDLASRIDSNTVEKALYTNALDRLNVGVIVVDVQQKTVSASAVAERLLNEREGLHIQAGRLRATNAAEDRDLQTAIRAVSQKAGEGDKEVSFGLSLTKRSGARTLGIVVRRAATGRAADDSQVAIYVRDCDTVPEIENEFVRQIFDLTPAEAAVTRRLATGLSLEDAATSLGISRNTARAHLRSIFSKSGITRQTELVRLVLNSAVLLGEKPCEAA